MPLQPAGTRLTRDAAAVPGPVDRAHFMDEQRRNRRASWRISVFAVAAAALSGLPLSILLSPLLFGLTLVIFHSVDVVAPVPTWVWNTSEQVARAVPSTSAIMRGNGGTVPWALLAAALVLPGAIVMLAVWVWIRVLFRHVGVGGMLSRLGARPPQRNAT